MGDRIVEISTAAARLSIRHRQLVVTQGPKERSVPVEDLAILVLGRPDIVLTQPVLTYLAEAGVALVSCSIKNHLPASISLPISGHWEGTAVAQSQLSASKPVIKRLWQHLVQTKIRQQASVLASLGRPQAGLIPLANRVRSGDPDNLEAQAAQRYWPILLGGDFRRRREGTYPNNLLNYGYAVLRAAMARAVVAAGLLPMIGLHHHNRGNHFCLVDDLMEPYRPFVDLRVMTMMDTASSSEDIGTDEKKALISILHERISMSGPTHGDRLISVLQATQATAVSLVRALREEPSSPAIMNRRALTLPEGGFVPEPKASVPGQAVNE